MFSSEFCEISKNTFLTEHLWWLLQVLATSQGESLRVIFRTFSRLTWENFMRNVQMVFKGRGRVYNSLLTNG